MRELIYLTVVLPLLGFLINGIFGSKIKSEKIIGLIGSGTIGISFIITLLAFFETLALPNEQRQLIVTLFTWLKVGGLDVSFAYQVDQLSLVMALVVTGVGFIIHVYSIGYMHGDKGFWRFFAYLNLFIFAMMNLILADNFVLLFLGWEGVGLCSYLLIGFWYDRKFENSTTADAAKKAFIVNRIGDFGFLLGMFLIFLTFGSLNFNEVFSKANTFSISTATYGFIALFLFIGATGKSAQIPLYVWLPDAMAGPTPVSALIHAATMVTAGVYMVARCSIIFASAPAIMMVVAIIGIMTAFFAATIGLVQNDIKKVLAYSTVSQLGYMIMALGIGAYQFAFFHLVTHAFFKAALFLGSGSVIHAMHHEQDIQKMGGLRKKMPLTYWTFIISSLAISGIPLTSGFLSKDGIIASSIAFSDLTGHYLFPIFSLVVAFLTAFYMFRMYFMTFEGDFRGKNHHIQEKLLKEAGVTPSHEGHHGEKPHESPLTMTFALMMLAIPSVLIGLVGMPWNNRFEEFIAAPKEEVLEVAHHFDLNEFLIMGGNSVGIALIGITIASLCYLQHKIDYKTITQKIKPLYQFSLNKWYFDDIYDRVFVQGCRRIARAIMEVDYKVVDGAVNLTGLVTIISGEGLKYLENGRVQFYALIVFGAVLGFVIAFTVVG